MESQSVCQKTYYKLTGFSKDVDGRPLEFQDTEPALPICALCGLVPAETYTLTCKHIFCTACYTGVVQKTKTSLHCPVDDKAFRPRKALRPSSKASDSILQLVVFCFNKPNGCSFFGTAKEMLEHFGGCPYWEVTCQLCDTAMLRSGLFSHVQASHAKQVLKTKNNTSTPTPSAVLGASAAIASFITASPVTAASETTFLVTEPSQSSQYLLKSIGELISRSTDEIKRTQELQFARMLSSINSLKRPLGPAAGLLFPGAQLCTAYAEDLDFVDGKGQNADEVVPYTMYPWSVSPYSKLRVGVHYFSSDVFQIGPGYSARLKGSIDSIATVELKVEVTIWAVAGSCKASGDNKLLDSAKVCFFKVVNNNNRKDCLFSQYLLEEAFRKSSLPLNSPEGDTSGWMDVGVIDRALFELDFVHEDSFLIIFGIGNTPKE